MLVERIMEAYGIMQNKSNARFRATTVSNDSTWAVDFTATFWLLLDNR